MKHLIYALLILCVCNKEIAAQSISNKKTIITNVNIISVDPSNPMVMHNADVFIEKGKIKKIRPAANNRPKGYEVINAKDKYLVPGLSDMHVHLPRSSSVVQAREFYLLNLLNGVTTIRQMRGKQSDLVVRDSVRKGLMLGCNTYISTPPFFYFSDDYKKNFFSAQMCKDSLTRYKQQGYDFVKYVGGLNLKQYDTLVSVATSLKMKVTGHAPNGDLEKAVQSNQYTIEHIDPFVKLYQKDTIAFWKVIDEMAQKQLFNCPDMRYYIVNFPQTTAEKRHSFPGVEFFHNDQLKELEKDFDDDNSDFLRKNPMAFARAIIEDSAKVAVFQKILPRMHQKGVKLITSAGAGDFFVPGFSLLDELELYVAAGISPFETIKCASYNAADCFGELDKWGTISEGKNADMVLLNANPLDDIKNLRKIEATIIHGNVLTHDLLAAEIKKVQSEPNKLSFPKLLPLAHMDSVRLKKFVDSALYKLALYSHERDACLDSALAIVPSYAYLWQQKSNPTVKQRKYELAIQYLDSAVKYGEKQYLDYRGFTKCIFQKNYNGAIKDFQAAFVLNGNSGVMDHSYDFYFGLCHLQLNHFDSAEYYLAKSIDAKTKTLGETWVHPTELFYYAVTQYEKQDYKKANEYFDNCLKLYKNFGDALYYKARCLEKLDKKQEAIIVMTDANNNVKQGYTFTEDSVPYEQFPYQVNKRMTEGYLDWLKEDSAKTKK